MLPDYRPGDFVFIGKLGRFFPLRVGDDVVFHHSQYGILIKRLLEIRGQHIRCTGLSSETVSSVQIGWIPITDVIGRVVWNISRS